MRVDGVIAHPAIDDYDFGGCAPIVCRTRSSFSVIQPIGGCDERCNRCIFRSDVGRSIGWAASGKINEVLTGYEEDPLALSTTGSGEFIAQIGKDDTEIEYELSYAGLEGSVAQAHIHLGGSAQGSGISIFLCTNLGNGPAGTQACPAAPATVSGVIAAADVIGPTGQGIAAGELAEILKAMRAGATYVNMHSAKYPGGEIRAQITVK